MESARKIIDAAQRGVSPQELAMEFPWHEIDVDGLLELLRYAQYSPDNAHSFQIFSYLLRVSKENDAWFFSEVLSQTVRHPIVTTTERIQLLEKMRLVLDQLKNGLSAHPPSADRLRHYWLMEGGYYIASAASAAEQGQIDEANRFYQIAQGIFEQMGMMPDPAQLSSAAPAEPARRNLPVEGAGAADVLMPDQPPAGLADPALDSFHPLPDVWVEGGRLQLPPVDGAASNGFHGNGASPLDLNADPAHQALLIEQQSEILAGIQLQIQLYLARRAALASEVMTLEKKTAALKALLSRLEKKVGSAGE